MDSPLPPSGRRWPARLLAAATAAYAGLLVWATHYPKPQELLGDNPPSDKLMHVIAYTILGLLVGATLAAAGRLTPRGGAVAVAALGLFAVLDELTQPLPWFRRTADPVDWIFDAAGIVTGIAAIAVLAAAVRLVRGRAQ